MAQNILEYIIATVEDASTSRKQKVPRSNVLNLQPHTVNHYQQNEDTNTPNEDISASGKQTTPQSDISLPTRHKNAPNVHVQASNEYQENDNAKYTGEDNRVEPGVPENTSGKKKKRKNRRSKKLKENANAFLAENRKMASENGRASDDH